MYNFYDNPVIKKSPGFHLATLDGTDYHGRRNSIELEDISLLCTGATMSGKTQLIKKILLQTSQYNDTIHIIFDPKGDFINEFYKDGDIIISFQDTPNYPTSAQPKWNLLKDMSYNGELEINIREMAQSIFQKAIEGSQSPYFPQAACNLFTNLMIAMCRHCSTLPSTREAIQKICSMSIEEMLNATDQYTDLASTKLLIGGEAPQTVSGVLGELINCLQNTFQGNFLDVGDFSFREFIRKEGVGKKLFIEYQFENKRSCETAIELILNICMKEALTGKSNAKRINFYLDEFPELPGKLTYLPDLVNFGRQVGIRVIAGIQSVAQLYSVWGEKEANALLAGFVNNIVFFCNDSDSIRYFSEHAGEKMMSVPSFNLDFTISTTVEKVPIVPAYIFTHLTIGDCIIFTRATENQYPFFFHFDK